MCCDGWLVCWACDSAESLVAGKQDVTLPVEDEDEKMDSNGINSKVTFVLGEESGGSCIDDEGHSPRSEKESYEHCSSQTLAVMTTWS